MVKYYTGTDPHLNDHWLNIAGLFGKAKWMIFTFEWYLDHNVSSI